MVFLLKERVDTNLLAMTFWLIWSKRNLDRCGEKFVEIINIRGRANTLLQDFFAAQNPRLLTSTISIRAVRWIPPISPHYKINFDGACFSTKGAAGLGAVIRDASGKVLGALAQRIKKNLSQLQPWRPWHVIELCFLPRTKVFWTTFFQGDAETIIKAILASDSSYLENGHVISDILQLSGVFSFCSFFHVKCLGNSVAHFLARSSKSGSELQVWQNSVPDDMALLVTRDSL